MKCGTRLSYEVLGLMRVYRVVDGRRRYKFQCSGCGHTGENDGRARFCQQKVKKAS